jgi:class 3 adenylate cyclase
VRESHVALQDDLKTEVNNIFRLQWVFEKATAVPAPEDLRLNTNHAKEFEFATVVYADIDGSTSMVDGQKWTFAAEVYKAYLRCASEILKNEGGTIAAYDGDRVMAVFVGGSKNTSAVRAALKINGAVINIINPAIKAQYSDSDFVLKHVVGIDTSLLHVARVGVHGDNDLVWVGRAANYAAKLCTLSGTPTWITKIVYDSLRDETKVSNGVNMWKLYTWTAMNKIGIYASTYQWTPV